MEVWYRGSSSLKDKELTLFLINFFKICKKNFKKAFFLKKRKNLWPLFMDGVQLPQG